MSSKWFITAKLTVSLGFLGWLITRFDLNQSWQMIQTFNLWYFLPVLILSLVGFVISAYKWKCLLEAAEQHAPFLALLRLFWIGAFFNNFLPGRIGGDVIRIYGVTRHTQNKGNAAATVLIDRAFNLIGLMCIAIAALPWSPITLPVAMQQTLSIDAIALCALGGAGFWIGIRFARRHPRVNAAMAGSIALVRNPIRFSWLMLFALFYQTSMILSNYAVAQGLGISLSLTSFFILIPITAVVTMLPFSINGWGLRESAFVVLFAHYGVSPEATLALSILTTLSTMGLSLIGAWFYIQESVSLKSRHLVV